MSDSILVLHQLDFARQILRGMENILTEAKRRYSDRKKAGKLRRLITMLENQS